MLVSLPKTKLVTTGLLISFLQINAFNLDKSKTLFLGKALSPFPTLFSNTFFQKVAKMPDYTVKG